MTIFKRFLFSRGEISSTAEIDYEAKAEYNISITVSDGRFVSIIRSKINKNLIDKEEISAGFILFLTLTTFYFTESFSQTNAS